MAKSTKTKRADFDPAEYLPLNHADLHILLSLADEDRHGYAIMQNVAIMTEQKLKLGPGTLYTSLKRLLDAALIEETDERPDPSLDDERRRYYRLSKSGSKVLAAEMARLASLVRHARVTHVLKEV